MRDRASSGSTLVFAHRHVADPMQSIFDAPVASPEFKKVACIGPVATDARDGVADFAATLAINDAYASDTKCLGEARPVEMTWKSVAYFDLADLDATMPFVERAVSIKLLLSKALA